METLNWGYHAFKLDPSFPVLQSEGYIRDIVVSRSPYPILSKKINRPQ